MRTRRVDVARSMGTIDSVPRIVTPIVVAVFACACSGSDDGASASDAPASDTDAATIDGAHDDASHDAAGDAAHDSSHVDVVADSIALDAGPTITVSPLVNISAPGADLAFDYLDSIPIGWGYMDPLVVTIGADVFTPTFYPTDLSTHKALYDIQLYKKGVAFGPALSLAYDFIPPGYSTEGAYQPPMLFVSGTKIIAQYWVDIASSASASIVQRVSIDTAAASPAWSLVSTAWATAGHSFNYLGAAMGPDGRIYVAGADAVAGTSASLTLFAYDTIGDATPQTIDSWSGTAYAPLYSHVVVDASNDVYVLTTLGNFSEICAATGMRYTNYKDIVLYKGTAGGTFKAQFSNASADVAGAPATNGDPCQPYDSRFPLDLFFDAASGHVYSVVRAQDVISATGPVSTDYTQKVEVLDETGAIVAADLSTALSPVIPSGKFLDAVSISKVGARFVVFGSSRDEPTQTNIALTTTTDFKSFSPVVAIATPYGPGNSVKISQPNKNGSAASADTVHFWFGGNLLNPEKLNRFLDFSLGAVTVK